MVDLGKLNERTHNTLFGLIVFLQVNNLPPPYGVCGSRDLKYFSSPYSMHKCQRECLIDYIQASCGCVEPYMAGKFVLKEHVALVFEKRF